MSCCRRAYLAISLGIALTSCTNPAPPRPATGIPNVEAREDPSHRFITFIGPKAQHAPPFLGIPETNFYCLRSFIDHRTGETAHQLYVTDSYLGTERGWNAARDSMGASLPFIAIGDDEITCDAGCSYVEEFAAKLPETTLRRNSADLAITFLSRSGDEKRIVVPAEQITAQLAAIDLKRSPPRPVSASGTASP